MPQDRLRNPEAPSGLSTNSHDLDDIIVPAIPIYCYYSIGVKIKAHENIRLLAENENCAHLHVISRIPVNVVQK